MVMPGSWPPVTPITLLRITALRNGSQNLKCVSVSLSVMSDSLQPRQAPLSLKFSRQEHWGGNHFLLQGIFLTQGLKTGSPTWKAVSLTSEPLGKPQDLKLENSNSKHIAILV